MAENKKSFLLYCDLIHTVKKMPKEKAGELFMHILEYVNDLEPNTDDLIIQLTFEPIRQSLKRDLEKYERIRLKNKENADKRWNKNNTTECDRIQPNAKNADNDNDNDNVSDSDILFKKETKYDVDGENFSNDENFEKKEEAKNFLKNSKPQFYERIRMQHKITKEHYDEKVDEFVEKKFDWGENDWKDLDDMAKNFEFWMPSNYRRTVNPYKSWSEDDFKEDCRKHLKKFGKEMVNTFFNHFRQVTPDGEMLFQTKAAWNTEAQLKNWYNKNLKKNYANTR